MRAKTKIIATLGPSLNSEDHISHIVQAGVSILRINFSHGSPSDIERLFEISNRVREKFPYIAILADLQGPKIRIQNFSDGSVEIKEGDPFFIDASFDPNNGDKNGVGTSFQGLEKDLKSKDILLLDDGKIKLEVQSIEGSRIYCLVIDGGLLSNRKGINKRGGGLSTEALSDDDMKAIDTASRYDADYIAISFVKSGKDVKKVKNHLNELGASLGVISKIERAEAVEAIEEILYESDGIMIARGDLGIEIGYAELTAIQKTLIKKAKQAHKISITATQMLESMIHSKTPTRAEVSDVANAVMDGTDAVMLSAETAVGEYPIQAVETMQELCLGSEKHDIFATTQNIRLGEDFFTTQESIAMASTYIANHYDLKAMIALTESGDTAHWMSRQLNKIPIYAVSSNIKTLRKVSMFRGVIPLGIESSDKQDISLELVIEKLREQQKLNKGDRVIFTFGDLPGKAGGTNNLRIFIIN
jgi:pyruvate kinase